MTAAGTGPSTVRWLIGSQAFLTVVCQTRPVTSLTPRSRLLVSGLVLPALGREDQAEGGQQASGGAALPAVSAKVGCGTRWQGPWFWGRGSTSTEGARESPRSGELHERVNVRLLR